MPRVVDSTAQWEFSARTRGEVLIAEARDPGIYLALLGVPAGFTPDEVEGWLHDVAGVARETAAGDVALKPIPALLHHALTGMLFSHAEMWNRPGSPAPSSVVFVREGGEVGFGCVGDVEVAILIDDQPADVSWVTVRDDEGREARAWSIDVDRTVRVRITWSTGPEPGALAARIAATWHGGAAEPRSGHVAHVAAPAPVPPPSPRAVEAAPAPPPEPPPVETPAAPAIEPGDEIGFGADFLLEPSPALDDSARGAPTGLPEWGTPPELPEEPEPTGPVDAAALAARMQMGTFGPVAEPPPEYPAEVPP